ncbi:RES family NAD+ phosphorylase [Mucilaginibacter sabulilitoris]|uniref:RES family NAD+ phosphorylase n=1 Tax=Mucilaginibacter sabulilitoris TaxID=1173583 RepID=A0ABZ0TTS5_9SPHI|nr:RES family NAD+ phosphorylase [Mucilaginibacter sabulilitoris]WPU96509.1 RES family NAD+ phosphorylase [Mucilaginibacter sabulilitoris]
MNVYRISQTKYAHDRKGSGIDGRWNSMGQYIIYTGGSLALSCLEKLAHTPGTSLYSGDFSVAIITIPDSLPVFEITTTRLAKLNANWYKVINYPITQLLGDTWLRKMETAVLKVPSAIIDMEYNYLLNQAHPDYEKIKISSVSKFTFDPRLKAR